MTDSIFGSGWRALLLVGLSVVGIALTVRAERASESRANRLHRADPGEGDAGLTLHRRCPGFQSAEQQAGANDGCGVEPSQ